MEMNPSGISLVSIDSGKVAITTTELQQVILELRGNLIVSAELFSDPLIKEL